MSKIDPTKVFGKPLPNQEYIAFHSNFSGFADPDYLMEPNDVHKLFAGRPTIVDVRVENKRMYFKIKDNDKVFSSYYPWAVVAKTEDNEKRIRMYAALSCKIRELEEAQKIIHRDVLKASFDYTDTQDTEANN